MNEEKSFSKYKTRGPDYHYKQITKSNIKLYNAFISAKYYLELSLILRLIKKGEGRESPIKILDVGCGDGVMFFLLEKRFPNYNFDLFGIDNSNIALDIANKKVKNAHFKNADVYNLPFEDNSFDLIISSDVIEHVVNYEKMLSEIKRVGKYGAFVIIGTPLRYLEKSTDKTHYHEFYPEEFHKLLEKYFTGVKTLQSHKLLYLLLYNKKLVLFGRKFDVFRYIFNFLTIFVGRNPFLKFKRDDNDVFSYIFGIGKIQ